MKKGPTKKVLTFVLVLAMLFSLSAVGLVPAAAADNSNQYTFQVLFTSDVHGCFYDWNYSTNASSTGLARIATTINQLRTPDTILLDVGDAIQGNGTTIFTSDAWSGLFPTVQGFQYLNYDAVVLGNHEFNFGIPALEKAYGIGQGPNGSDTLSIPVLSGNVLDKDGKQAFDAYFVKTMPNGLRVAIIGMTTPNIDRWDAANLEAAGYTTESATKMTEQTIKYLKDNNLADVFVAAEHMGTDSDIALGREGADARDVLGDQYNADNLAIFIGAHDHTQTDTIINGVRFVEVKNAGAQMGQVQVTVTKQSDGTWAVADKTADTSINFINYSAVTTNANYVASDPGYLAALKDANDFGIANCTTVIGQLIGDPLVPNPTLKGTYEGYLQDTALIHLINNAMLYYTNQYVASDEFKAENPDYSNMSVTLSGTAPLDTNANHQPGDITRGSASTIYKYDNNTLYVLAMTGAEFKQWMEWSYTFVGPFIANNVYNMGPAMKEGDLTIPYGNGNMPGYNMDQFAGVTYKVDLTKPVGSRIVDLKDAQTGGDFDLSKTYLVAVNNYRANSQLCAATGNPVYGDSPKPIILAQDIETKFPGTGEGMLGVMINYIQNQLGGTVDNTDNKLAEPANWSYITPYIDPALQAKAIAAVNAGEIALSPVNGNSYAVRAVTTADLGCVAFQDIPTGVWYYDAVDTALKSGLMNGTGPYTFDPDSGLTREMMVTILYRLAGQPAVDGAPSFTDVPADQWYTDAIAWGEQAGLVQGIGGSQFGLGQLITRQEMATLLFRYLLANDLADSAASSDLSVFSDSGAVASWALDAMKFSVGTGLIQGTADSTLDPAGLSTRAQAATLLTRVTDYIDSLTDSTATDAAA